MKQLFNKTTDQLIAKEVIEAKSFFSRAKGLLGRASLDKETALWIHRCPSVHTFFMKFSIDVIFHDKNMRVTNVIENLKPWRMTRVLQIKNHSCFEFSSQNISKVVSRGDVLDVRS